MLIVLHFMPPPHFFSTGLYDSVSDLLLNPISETHRIYMVEFNERTEQLITFPSCLIKLYIFCAFTTLIISSLKSVKSSLLNPMFEMLGDAAFRPVRTGFF